MKEKKKLMMKDLTSFKMPKVNKKNREILIAVTDMQIKEKDELIKIVKGDLFKIVGPHLQNDHNLHLKAYKGEKKNVSFFAHQKHFMYCNKSLIDIVLRNQESKIQQDTEQVIKKQHNLNFVMKLKQALNPLNIYIN